MKFVVSERFVREVISHLERIRWDLHTPEWIEAIVIGLISSFKIMLEKPHLYALPERQ